MTKSKTTAFAAGLLLCCTILHAAPPAQTVTVTIESQPLDLALNAFAEQTGLQLLFRANRVTKDMKVKRLAGTYTPQEALSRLLANTGLRYEYLDAQTVTILSATETSDKSAPPSTGQNLGPAQPMRLSLAQTDAFDAPPSAAPDTKKKATSDSKEDMVVEGEREKRTPYRDANLDLPRSIDDVKPYYIFNAKQIETSGALNVEDFLYKRMPMQTGSQIYSNLSGSSVTGHVRGASQINIRGLGVDQTLVLINGRRVPSIVGNNSPEPVQGDLNGIPLSAIDRIEVMPSSASGIYGASAVGGVINVILKRKYVGYETKLSYDNTFDEDAGRRRMEASAGFSLEDGRTQILLSGSYYDANSLTVRDRYDHIRAARDRVYRNAPFYSLGTPPLGASPNIFTSSPALTLKGGGGSLGSNATFLPVGFRGVTQDGTLGIRANAGRFNMDYANTAQPDAGLDAPLGSTPRTTSFIANFRRQMTDRLEMFLDASYDDNYTTDRIGQTFAISVPTTVPTNPFNETVSIYIPDDSMTENRFNSITTRNISGGFNFKLGHNWQLQGDHSWGDSKSAYIGNATDATLFNAALNSGALNLFVDTGTYPVDLVPYRNARRGDTESEIVDSSLRAFGPIFMMPGGEVTLAATVNRREISAPDVYLITTVANRPAGNTTVVNPARSQATVSEYLEATIPLFGTRNARTGFNMFEVQLAARREDYEVDTVRTSAGGSTYTLTVAAPTPPTLTYGSAKYSSTDPTVGFRYKPTADIMMRVSWSTAFRPPGYSQLQAPVLSTLPTNVLDPRRGNASTPVFTLGGGNPELRPENAENWTAGIVLTPTWLSGLRLALDYTSIEKTDNISSLSAQLIVDNEAEFPSRVVRNPPATGQTVGTIATVETSSLNLYGATIETLDLSASYNLDTSRLGNFNFSALVTKLITATNQTSRTAPARDYVGRLIVTPGGAEYRGNFGVDWSHDRWTAGWSMSYIGSYFQLGPPYTGLTEWLRAQGSPTIPSQSYHDVYMGYSIPKSEIPGGHSWLSGTQFQFGMKNVLDTVSSFDAASATTGYYVGSFGDLRLRSYWFSAKKSF